MNRLARSSARRAVTSARSAANISEAIAESGVEPYVSASAVTRFVSSSIWATMLERRAVSDRDILTACQKELPVEERSGHPERQSGWGAAGR
jgi:hypothetical protein